MIAAQRGALTIGPAFRRNTPNPECLMPKNRCSNRTLPSGRGELQPLISAGGSLLCALLLLGSRDATAADVCVSNADELDREIARALIEGGETSIRVVQGSYDMPYDAYLLRPAPTDLDGDDVVSVPELLAFLQSKGAADELVDSEKLSIVCGYTPECQSRSMNAEDTQIHFSNVGLDESEYRDIVLQVTDDAELVVDGCTFSQQGTAFQILHGNDGEQWFTTVHPKITLRNNRFLYDGAFQIPTSGVIFWERFNSEPTIVFQQNVVSGFKAPHAGVLLKDDGDKGNILIANNTIAGNGIGLSTFTDSSALVTGNVIAQNDEADMDLGGAHAYQNVLVQYSLVNSIVGTPVIWHWSNRTGDPLFVDLDAHDLRLGAGSVAIDGAAYGGSIGALSPFDVQGAPRIQGASLDMGAYEWSKGYSGNGGK